MWYSSLMPEELPDQDLELAEEAVLYAQSVRRLHRRRTDRNSSQRKADIEMALSGLRKAMRPLRTHIGRFPYGPATVTAEKNREAIYEASRRVQSERRKLWKMK